MASSPAACFEPIDGLVSSNVPNLAGLVFPRSQTVTVQPSGLSNVAQIAVEAGSTGVVLRLTPLDRPDACLQIYDVVDAAGTTWVSAPTGQDFGSYCLTCPQRVSVSAGPGLYVLPSNAALPALVGPLSIRVMTRSCATLAIYRPAQPERVQIELQGLREPRADLDGVLPVQLIITPGSFLYQQSTAQDVLTAVLDGVNTALAPARLRVVVAAAGHFDSAGTENLAFSEGNLQQMNALSAKLQACRPGASPAALPIYFAGCLSYAPLGQPETLVDGTVTHIPSGVGVSQVADGVMLMGRGCAPEHRPLPFEAGHIARVLAHELGHGLGLYHSVEADGIEDQLPDTDAKNVMFHAPLLDTSVGLSAGQVAVLRRHPLVVYP